MLASEQLMAFVTVTNADRAREFYRDKLGLRLMAEDSFALMFECAGAAPLRVALAKEVVPANYTVLGWNAKNVSSTVEALKKAGITCEVFGFFKQDDVGIWTAPGGAEVAWFKDPDGNLLSVSHHS